MQQDSFGSAFVDAIAQVGQAALEEPLLRPRLGQLDGACVGGTRFILSAQPPEQVGASRVVVAVVLQLELPVEERDLASAVYR